MKSQENSVRTPLPLEVVRNTLWHFGNRHDGWEPGSFTTHLLRAIGASDVENRERLRVGFPEYVRAAELVMLEPWGLDYLVGLVRAAADDEGNQLAFVGDAS